jgi:hypothetical protein
MFLSCGAKGVSVNRLSRRRSFVDFILFMKFKSMYSRFIRFSGQGIFAATVLFAIVTPSADAALTVTVSAVPGEPGFFISNGVNALPDGSFYQLGTFATPPAAQNVLANPAAAFSQWQEFADATDEQIFTIAAPGGNAAGDIYGDDSFAGKTIYWWVFLTSDGAKPAADFSNVTEHALFTGNTPGWFFPESQEAVAPVISTADGLNFLAGGLTGDSSGVQLIAAIPEPGALTLSSFTLLAALRRRRR